MLQFNDTTNKRGIVQVVNRYTKTTTDDYPVADIAIDASMALARFFLLANQADGRWEVDDNAHTDYPILTTDLVANQQDYAFTNDQNGNQIWEILQVEIKTEDDIWQKLRNFDIRDTTVASEEYYKTAGIPVKYDLITQSLFLYPKSSYNKSSGLKIFVKRAPDYFVAGDTTKSAGIPDMFQEYLAVRPAYQFAVGNGLKNANQLFQWMNVIEEAIQEFYRNRSLQAKQPRIITRRTSSR